MTSIYGLIDPLTDEVRYIGKTLNPKQRYADHICIKRGKPNHAKNWISALVRSGFPPYMVILEETDTWMEAEAFYISYFKSLGARLTNTSSGGEIGPVGWKPTIEQRAKMSAKQKARIAAYRSAPLLNMGVHNFITRQAPMTAEGKRRLSVASKAYWRDTAKREQLSKEMKERHVQGAYSYSHLTYRPVWDEQMHEKSKGTKRNHGGWGKYGYKGVALVANKQHPTWEPRYTAHAKTDKRTYLGCFKTPEEAARAYDKAMFDYWGADTFLNFPFQISAQKTKGAINGKKNGCTWQPHVIR